MSKIKQSINMVKFGIAIITLGLSIDITLFGLTGGTATIVCGVIGGALAAGGIGLGVYYACKPDKPKQAKQDPTPPRQDNTSAANTSSIKNRLRKNLTSTAPALTTVAQPVYHKNKPEPGTTKQVITQEKSWWSSWFGSTEVKNTSPSKSHALQGRQWL